MDIFVQKSIKPMLISENQEAFNSPDYIYELKLDGIRCIIYIDKNYVEIRNKRNLILTPYFPEFAELFKQVKTRCILDGELIVMQNGVPDFFEIQRRALMKDNFKIKLSSSKLPASFTAFDIIYHKDKQITDLPLMKRKKLLTKTVIENPRIAVSRYIEEKGIEFYNIAEQQNLEGIVAKRKDSKYYFDKKTKDWIKIKNLKDDDYIVCGYILKEKNVTSLILGQYDRNDNLVYKGHVTFGVSGLSFLTEYGCIKSSLPPFNEIPKGNENAVWLVPNLVCVVKYMMKTDSGGLRQPVFKAFRNDKVATDCKES